MKTRALALIALAFGVAGCRENLTSIYANGFCAPPEDAATCGVPTCDTMVSAFAFGGGTAGTGALVSWIEWQNNLVNNGIDGERLNTNDFFIDGYEWEIISPVRTTTLRDRLANTFPIKAGGSAIVGLFVIPPAGTPALQADHAAWVTQVGGDATTPMPVRVRIKALGLMGDDSFYETGSVQAAVYFNADFVPVPACPDGSAPTATCPAGVNQSPVSIVCPTATTP